ncbi:MAG: metallopeptidase TldD-related protein [Nitrospira sp.]|nr:metallopeptidase TldD-related protein [Nitrospira sp.]
MSQPSAKPWPKMTSREEFRFLVDVILACSSGDHTVVTLQDEQSGTTRFANNRVIQNVDRRRGLLTARVSFGHRHGTASTTDFTAGAVRNMVARAERIARVAPEDPEYLPPPAPRPFPPRETARAETIAAGPTRRLEYANEAIGLCRMENLMGAGIVSSSVAAIGVAADNGLFGYEMRTEAEFSITVHTGDTTALPGSDSIGTGSMGTGWSAASHRSIDHLRIQERTLAAIDKAKRNRDARELPPGEYPVILEPAAVAGLWFWLIQALDAKSYTKGTSPVTGQMGKPIVDQRLTLSNAPDHPDLLGVGFTQEGLPSAPSRWIDAGCLQQLSYDRFTAQACGIKEIPTLEAPILSVQGASYGTIRDLVKQIDRAILVTNFWYIRSVNRRDLTLTGMTRDGTFLVENGHLVCPVKNFRFHDSPLRVFRDIDAATVPLEALSPETGKMLTPALVLPRFHFSSVTRW